MHTALWDAPHTTARAVSGHVHNLTPRVQCGAHRLGGGCVSERAQPRLHDLLVRTENRGACIRRQRRLELIQLFWLHEASLIVTNSRVRSEDSV
eukprot:6106848-Pleurochrysis_carterae.AAC.2